MSTHSGYSETAMKHHELMPIGAALMVICTLITIFVINPEQYGYAAGAHPLVLFEGAGLILGSVLIGYIALVFRSA
jgi:hypothetical protein